MVFHYAAQGPKWQTVEAKPSSLNIEMANGRSEAFLAKYLN
jgi:hypothetical protein